MEYLPTLSSLLKARSKEMCPQKERFLNTDITKWISLQKAQIHSHVHSTECGRCFKKQETKPCPGYKNFTAYKRKK